MNALISFSEDLENGYVLISYGPAPYCGNLGMISFLDRCLSRLYKIASRDLWDIRNWWFSRKPPVLQNFQKRLQLSLRLM